MSLEHAVLMKELKLESNIANLLAYFESEGLPLESIGFAFQTNTFKLFLRYAREQYKGITDQLLVKMFSEWSAVIASDYLKGERTINASRQDKG